MTVERLKRELRAALYSPALAVVAAFVLRMSLLWWIHRDRDAHVFVFFPSSYENWNVGWALATGKGFSEAIAGVPGPTALVAPGYPLLIALGLKLSNLDGYTAIVLCLFLNCLASALTCWPIYEIGKRIGNHQIGLASAWLWVFLPTAILYPLQWLWDPSFSAFFLTVLICWTLSLASSGSTGAWVGYGLLWGVAVLMSPALAILFPFLILWLAWRRGQLRLPWIPQSATAILCFLLTLAPWTARNYFVFGKFVPVRSSFGLDFWMGNNPSVKNNWSPGRHPIGDPNEKQLLVQMGEARYTQLKQHQAVEFIKARPGTFVRTSLGRFLYTWTGLGDVTTDRWLFFLHAKKFYIWTASVLSLLAFAGLYLSWESSGWEAAPVWVAPVIFPLTYYVSHTSLRHRHPIDPILSVFVVCALAWASRLVPRAKAVPGQPGLAQGN